MVDVLKAIQDNPKLKKQATDAGVQMFNGFVTKYGVTAVKWGIITAEIFELEEGDKVAFIIECAEPDELVKTIEKTVQQISGMKG